MSKSQFEPDNDPVIEIIVENGSPVGAVVHDEECPISIAANAVERAGMDANSPEGRKRMEQILCEKKSQTSTRGKIFAVPDLPWKKNIVH